MSGNIITTSRTLERRPAWAFLLSLLAPGLGQLYTGNTARGMAFLFFRIVPLWALPFYVLLTKNDSYLCHYLVCNLFAIAVHIASPVDALLSARRRPLIIPGRLNRPLYYYIYGALSLAVIAVSCFLLTSFFTLYRLPDSTSPLYRRGDLVLVNRLRAHDAQPGQAVLHRDGSLYRLIAAGNDRVYLEDGAFVVNGMELGHAVPDDADMNRLGRISSDDLYWESYGTRRYLIEQKMLRIKSYRKKYMPLKKDQYLLAKDRRSGSWIETAGQEDIQGRVEGIVFSRNVRKMLLQE